MTSISEAVKKSSEILKKNGIAEPVREAKSLLSLALEKDKTFLIAHPEYKLNKKEANLFQTFIERRSLHEPFQHIAGRQEFRGLDFIVTPDVLIPRPETEMIVEAGAEILRKLPNPRFCEIGTGSGCIAVSMLNEVKTARALGVDISPKALRITAENAEKHGVSDRLELRVSDVFDNLPSGARFDLIVSNPPYVPQADMRGLQPEVRDFDPPQALTDGLDGLSILRRIVEESPEFLNPDGSLVLEFGFSQSSKVREMFDLRFWDEPEFRTDLQGIPRTVSARIAPK